MKFGRKCGIYKMKQIAAPLLSGHFFFTVMSGEDSVEFCLDPLSVLRHSLSSLECWLLKVHSGDPLWELPSAKAAVSKRAAWVAVCICDY